MSIQTIQSTCDAGKEVTLVFLQPAQVAITATPADMPTQSDFSFPTLQNRVLRFASGLLSVKGTSITVRNRHARVSTDITVKVPGSDLELHTWADGRETVQRLSAVQRVRITDTAVTVKAMAEEQAAPVTPQPDTTGAENKKLKAKLEEQSRLMAELQQATRTLVAENKELTAKNRELTQKNGELTEQNRMLSAAAARALAQELTDRQADMAAVQQRMEEVRQQLAELEQQLAEEQRKLAEKAQQVQSQKQTLADTQQQLAQLEEEVAALAGQQEITELDLEEANKKLADIKNRLQLDGNVVALTESRWLKNNSVTQTLEEMAKKIRAVEDRIGFIINARERFNQSVQAAVLVDGDGSISAAEETGDPQQPAGQTGTEDQN